MRIYLALLMFFLGACIGSFLNVVIYRVPEGKSIMYPPSHCPKCGHRLSAKDLVPIFSYIALKGKCRYCGAKISPVYPIVESITAFMFMFLFLQYGLTLMFFKYITFTAFLIVISMIDFNTGYVNDALVIPFTVIGFVFTWFTSGFWSALWGSVIVGGFLLIVVYASKIVYGKEGGMGEGDIFAGLMVGAFLGFKLSIVSLFLTFILGAVIAVVVMLFQKKSGKTAVPFVPFMALGSFITMFAGPWIVRFYSSLLM
jgi:leader peptidase (prepilin peptidase)/N-methyltransferase